MLTDPQSITINGVAISLPRVSVGDLTSTYQSADGSTAIRISHTASGRERSLVRLDQNKIGADPFLSTVSKTYLESVYLVVDRPFNGAGFTDTETSQAIAGFLAYCSVAGFADKVIGFQS